MIRKLGVQILAVALLLLMSGADSMAQTRIRFKRGTNSATVTGTLGPGGVKSYVLRASQGQSLTATLSSTNGKVDFTQGNIHDTQYSITVEETGDVVVMIDNHGGTTRYTLTISIQ